MILRVIAGLDRWLLKQNPAYRPVSHLKIHSIGSGFFFYNEKAAEQMLSGFNLCFGVFFLFLNLDKTGNSWDKKLARWTKWIALVWAVLGLVLGLI